MIHATLLEWALGTVCLVALATGAADGSVVRASQGRTAPGGEGGVEWIAVEQGLWAFRAEYALAKPPGFDAERPYPVVVVLPPGKQDRAMAMVGLETYFQQQAVARGWVVVSIPSPGDVFEKQPAAVVARVIDDVAKRVLVEGGEVYLAGVSNGGRTALRAAPGLHDRVAAVGVLPGLAEGDESARWTRLMSMPVLMLVGERDARWVERTRTTHAGLVAAGAVATMEIVPNADHVLGESAGKRTMDFFEAQRKRLAAQAAESAAASGAGEAGGLDSAQRLRAAGAASRVIDSLHVAASAADPAYFDLYTNDAVFIGTDPEERWTVAELKAYSAKAFSSGKGWTYHPVDRWVRVAGDGQTAWFDELLDHATYGRCRGSGVLQRFSGEWRVAQYNLSVPIPNDVLPGLTKNLRGKLNKAR